MWYPKELLEHTSLGSKAERPGSLANLANTRKQTLSQFFTPLWLIEKVYNAVNGCNKEDKRRFSVLDNSCGSGRWFAYADKDKHSLYGVDIEETAIAKLESHVEQAGFIHDLVKCSMTDVRLGSFDFGFINPAFSIHLQSPYIKSEKGVTSYGKFGPDTAAFSHTFALTQALRACSIVAAIVPRNLTEQITNNEIPKAKKHLTHVYSLPKNLFADENIQTLECDLCIFDTRNTFKLFVSSSLDETGVITPITGTLPYSSPSIIYRGVDTSKPVVTLPVTGDKKVVLKRSGRNIKLSFECGLMQGKSLNAIFQSKLISCSNHRYPQSTRYAGQHLLDLQVLASQPKHSGLNRLIKIIRSVGGVTIVKPCVYDGLQAIRKREERQSLPFSQTVFQKTIKPLTATAKRFALLGKKPIDGVIKIGDKGVATRVDNGFEININNKLAVLEHDQFFSLFNLDTEDVKQANWAEKYPAIKETHPEIIRCLNSKAKRLGLDQWLSFSDYQYEDLLEICFKPRGAVCSWEMGLGKARLALSLCLMGGKRNLLIVKSRLVDEMIKEVRGLNIPSKDYKVIENAADCLSLSKINIISYDRLKSAPKGSKRTIASLLRNRIHTACADEGGILSNPNSKQSRAVWQINPKKRFVFDGTPIANFVRQFLPVACWTHGESVMSQPYSLRGEYLYPGLIDGARYQRRGIEAFTDDFVVTDWATNEFTDTLTAGAKREIPKIRDVGKFRHWVSGIIKRRVQQEPAVRKYVNFPIPTMHEPENIAWYEDHLSHYIEVVEWFAEWFKKQKQRAKEDNRNINLAIILAKLDAAFKAIQRPEDMGTYPTNYYGENSKDDWSIELIQEQLHDGNRPILYARNPVVLKRLAKRLDTLGISNLVFTGEESIKKRNKKLDDEFRNGNCQVLLASLGAAQDGLNLFCANVVIFYNGVLGIFPSKVT